MKCGMRKSSDENLTSSRKALNVSERGPSTGSPEYYLNSYHPLGETQEGKRIVQKESLPPFIDASIRREPDFQSPYPSITGLCRCNRLVGPAKTGDFIAYVTAKRDGVRQMVAILQVVEKLSNHQEAAAWYRRKRLSLPRNCMVAENPALPLALAVPPPGVTNHSEWDASYKWRAENYPSFLICKPLELNLYDPPVVPETIFGHSFPNTQVPKRLSAEDFSKLKNLLNEER